MQSKSQGKFDNLFKFRMDMVLDGGGIGVTADKLTVRQRKEKEGLDS
jgi:hypothetical protein